MGQRDWFRWLLTGSLGIVIVAGCTGFGIAPEVTDPPFGAPFIACPANGDGSIPAPAGTTVVPPGSIAVGYTNVQWEGAPFGPCGAVFVEGASTTLHRSDLPSPGIGIPIVASLVRPRPLVVHAPKRPMTRIFRFDDAGTAVQLPDSQQLQDDPQYQAWGWALPGAPLGKYRLQVISADGEVLAEGTFEIVD